MIIAPETWTIVLDGALWGRDRFKGGVTKRRLSFATAGALLFPQQLLTGVKAASDLSLKFTMSHDAGRADEGCTCFVVDLA
ncbi:hypothetical protein [uncultured Roseibium sp.]|uniref:hypothetical protein n=1 Tax=uncultured Roseibium sp. TaxID=1936171 RepID=UPI00262F29F1|nr:hypothetical protein [uncultured Roseibium sp.]